MGLHGNELRRCSRLSDVTVTDSETGVIPAYVSGDTNGNDELDLTETWLYEATGEAIAGQYNNLGNCSRYPTVGDNVDATDDDCYYGPSPCIDLVKTTNDVDNVCDPETGEIIPVGDPITWGYTVTNCGDVPLNDVTVTDSETGVVPAYVSGDTNGNDELDLTGPGSMKPLVKR